MGIRKAIAIMMAATLTLALTGCSASQQEQGSTRQTQSMSANAKSAKEEVSELVNSKWWKDYTGLVDELNDTDVSALMQGGSFQTLTYYSNKMQKICDERPTYSGKNDKVGELYGCIDIMVMSYNLSLMDTVLAAKAMAIKDYDSFTRYVKEATDAMTNNHEAVNRATQIADEIKNLG